MNEEHAYISLDVEDVLELYGEMFHCPAKVAADQLRAPDGLASAVQRPRNYAVYIRRLHGCG